LAKRTLRIKNIVEGIFAAIARYEVNDAWNGVFP